MKALVIKTNGEAEVIDQEWSYEQINETVGGWIEVISFGNNKYFAYANEEAKLLELPVNEVVTGMWYSSGQIVLLGDYISGDVVFFGGIDDNGDNEEVEQSLIDSVKRAGINVKENNNTTIGAK
jgi:hypothetical protein